MEPAQGERGSRPRGLAGRLVRTLLRVVGVGGPDTTEPLLRALRADHAELTRQLRALATTTHPDARRRALDELGRSLAAHGRAARETVYAHLGERPELAAAVARAVEQDARIDELATRAQALGPAGEGFREVVAELDRQVRAHLAEEESLASAPGPSEGREELARAFEERSSELRRTPARSRDVLPMRSATQRPQRRPRSDLEQRTMKELYAMARDRGLEGRSRMSKKELIAALGAPEKSR